jgi:hypothetical protein
MKYFTRTVVVLVVIASVVFLNGCNPPIEGTLFPAELRMENAANISKLSIGMTQDRVFEFMGKKTASQDQMTITNPYKIDMKYHDGITYEILYFYTQKSSNFAPFSFSVKDDDLTPLYFNAGKLAGWGKSFIPEDK